MAYKVIILYQLYMPSYFLGTFTEYPYTLRETRSYFLSNKGKYAPYPWASMSSLGIKRREALLIQ